jgi:hypothetical protein
VGARDKRGREDDFASKDPAILRIRLVSDGFSLDMMTVRKESRTVCSSHGSSASSIVSTIPRHGVRSFNVQRHDGTASTTASRLASPVN